MNDFYPDIRSYLGKYAKLHIYGSLESTNDTAKAMPGAHHGTLIIADSQTAGRGRYGRSFFSPPGCGIYMSIVLKPERLRMGSLSLMTPAAAVAVCETIESIDAIEPIGGLAPKVKWVNDVLIGDKKICGILTEGVTGSDGELERIIVGIGVNFTLPPGGFPPELAEFVGSLFSEQEPPITRCWFAAGIYNRLLARVETVHSCDHGCSSAFDQIDKNLHGQGTASDLIGNSPQNIVIEYKKRLLMLGRRMSVIGSGATYEAVALDIDSNGGLIIQKDDGEILTLSSGEISIRF